MEYKQMFIGMAIACLVSLAFFYWFDGLNTEYAGMDVGALDTTFNNNFSSLQSDLTSYATKGGDAQKTPGVSSESDVTANKGRGILGIAGDVISMPQKLITYGASAVGIPEDYVNIALATLIFVSALTLAYYLLFGSNK